MDRYSGTSNEISDELPGLVGRIMRQQDGKWCWTLNEKFTSVEWKSDGTPQGTVIVQDNERNCGISIAIEL